MIENKYCMCGEPINVEHNARQTFRKDGLRFFPPSDLIPGLCHFRCPACKEVVEYHRLVELGDLPIRPPADNAVEPVNSLQQLKQAIALVRRASGLYLSINAFNICKDCLDLIEQRACV